MKRPTPTAITAAMLCLAMAGPAVAQPPTTADPADAPFSADAADAQMAGDEPETLVIDPGEEASEEASSDDASGAVDEDGATAAGSGESEGKQLKGKLKRMLIGLLLPAVERRVRKAVGTDDDRSQTADDAEPELESAQASALDFESDP